MQQWNPYKSQLYELSRQVAWSEDFEKKFFHGDICILSMLTWFTKTYCRVIKKPSWKRSEIMPVHPSPKRKIICTYVIPQDVGLTCSYKCLLLGFLSTQSQISCVHVTQISFIIVLACYFSFFLTSNRERFIFFSHNFLHVWRLL